MRFKTNKKESILIDSRSVSNIIVDDDAVRVSFDVVVNPFFYLSNGINTINVSITSENISTFEENVYKSRTIQQFTNTSIQSRERFLSFKDSIVATKDFDLTTLVSNENLKERSFTHRFLAIRGLYPSLKIGEFLVENSIEGDGTFSENEIQRLLDSGISPDSILFDFPSTLPGSFINKKVRKLSKKIEKNLDKKQRTSKKFFMSLNQETIYDICEIKTQFTNAQIEVQIPLEIAITGQQFFAHIGESFFSSKKIKIQENLSNLVTKVLNTPIDVDNILQNNQNKSSGVLQINAGVGFENPSGRKTENTNFFKLQNKSQTFLTSVSNRSLNLGLSERLDQDIISNLNVPNPRILRTKASPSFISTVIGKSKKILHDSTTVNVPFFVTPTNDGFASIEITGPAPKNIISFQIQKREVLNFSDYQNVGEPFLSSEINGKAIIDKNVTHFKEYQYRLLCITSNGNTIFTSNTFEYFHTSNVNSFINENELIFEIESARIENRDSFPVVSFDLNIQITDEGFTSFRNFLSNSGVDESVLQGQLSDPKNYGNVISYSVTRQNLKTSEIENLGTHSSTSFVDDSSSNKRLGVSPLSRLDDYRYVFKPSIRPPSALTNEQFTEKRNPKTGKNYTFNSYKFFSRSNYLNLPSEEEMSQKPSDKIFSSKEFLTSKEVSTIIRSKVTKPKIFALRVSETLLGANSIKWKSSSQPGEIDHFQVYAILDGIESYIGSAHALDDNHEYEDYSLFNRVGEITYKIVPVLFDFTLSEKFETITITKKTSLPKTLEKILANQ